MKWAINPFFKPKKGQDGLPPDVERTPAGSSSDESPSSSIRQNERGFKKPTERFTAYQLLYIFILDGIGAFIVSGGINFAIAYGMYSHQDPIRKPIRLFGYPETLAGDAGVTVIVQCVITWYIELIFVNWDLKKGSVRPIGFIPEPKNRIVRWFMFLDRPAQTYEVGSFKHWFWFFASQFARSVLISAFWFPFIWGPSIGFLTIHGTFRDGDWYFDRVWTPQVFKLLQGGILGLLSTPPMVIFWLTRCGWALKNNEVHYGEL
ncbi:hypothetical protein F4821DRAFT_233226 [Hypoxylon rubiginosum]|uniref:Uncharacterized protein n=1 Tax=Hypoxylon rubiginosum TaxID=110542 RepID=A0ACC0D7L4_9PEZI|nr:hypothetical protein F4821DRAFT_233226 [Hypoxylon rubiginosum]